MNTRPLVIAALALVMACEGTRPTAAPTAPIDPSKLISDGAHGGNIDFFFLPPMVADPSSNPNFEPGKFNPNLAPNLSVEVCQLQTSPVNSSGQPVATDCVAGPPVKKFPAGTVTLQNPPDGFYQVVWHVGDSNLDASKFYRIRVLIDGSSTPFGVADIDPVLNMSQLRNARTGEVIPLNENSTLPIKFRIEHGGGSTLCGTSNLCVSTTVTNNDPSGFQNVTLDGGAGSIAGASFPNGWLPAGGPQSVVVTIAQISTLGGGSTADPTPCHVGLALPQYNGCFKFTTTPALPRDPETQAEFAIPVRVAVCYELDGTGGLEKFAELWSSGPNEPPHPLDDATDAGLLGAVSRNCTTTPVVIGQSMSANPLVRLASNGWQRVKHGVGQLFGVKSAYAVDLGLGGISTAFSNISPVRTQQIVTYTDANFTIAGGATTTSTARVIGNNHHATHTLVTGIGGVQVTFTLAPGNGSLLPIGGEGAGSNQVIITTNTNPIDGSPVSGGGFAPVNWTLPTTPGTYTLTANAAALGGPVTFTATVPGEVIGLIEAPWANGNLGNQ
jgi:hypothetical protein